MISLRGNDAPRHWIESTVLATSPKYDHFVVSSLDFMAT